MAIEAPQSAQNWATGNYHRILKVEMLCGPTEVVPRYHILVGFYHSKEAREQNPTEPLYVNTVDIPFDALLVDPRNEMYNMLMQSPLFAGTNAKRAE